MSIQDSIVYNEMITDMAKAELLQDMYEAQMQVVKNISGSDDDDDDDDDENDCFIVTEFFAAEQSEEVYLF